MAHMCVVSMQIDASTAFTYVPFEVRKNSWAKELCILPRPSKQCKKTCNNWTKLLI
jgi:hypothetical protein